MIGLTAPQIEGVIMTQVVLDVLAAGYRITVDDGEEELTPRQELGHILATMGATEGGDTLVFDNAAGQQVGWVQFIYGNDGHDVIADASANPATDALLANAERLADTFAAMDG